MVFSVARRVEDPDSRSRSARFRGRLAREGVLVIRLPPRSSNLNAHAERFVRSSKDECLSRVVPIGRGMVRVHGEFLIHTPTGV